MRGMALPDQRLVLVDLTTVVIAVDELALAEPRMSANTVEQFVNRHTISLWGSEQKDRSRDRFAP